MRLLLRMLGIGVTASVIAVACGGADFSSEGAPKGHGGSAGSGARGGSGGNGGSTAGDGSGAGVSGTAGDGQEPGSGGAGATSATGGTAGGGTTLCSDAKDCDDKDNCTLDTCLENGVCDNPPKCGGDEPACCNGVCSQCCGMGDCDDGLECTENTCFAGVCNFVPGSACGTGKYCSTNPADGPSGCLDLEDCDVDADCDNDDPCTQDSCVNHKCTHPVCPDGGSCCPGLGCGSCCGDSQCPQTDACNPSTCSDALKCETSPLCADGDLCCKSADGQTASCGSCCEAGDCADDGVNCTDAKCKSNADGFFSCSYVPNPDNCPVGQTCDARTGCSANQCKEAGDCADPTACKKVACTTGQCVYGDISCSHSQDCCPTTGLCQDCCDNKDCKDSSARFCCKQTGTCAACCQDSDCQMNQPTGGGPMPQALVGGVGGGDMPCAGPPTCDVGQCVTKSASCTATQKCCPGIGCVPLLNGGCPVTL